MGNLDPHRINFSYETISLEGELDGDWCSAVTEAYRNGDHRVVLEANHFISEKPDLHWRPSSGSIQYETFTISDPSVPGEVIDGIIHGAKLIQEVREDQDGEEYYYYAPYAVLSDVRRLARYETEEPLMITAPGERILVPINYVGRRITLYPKTERG